MTDNIDPNIDDLLPGLMEQPLWEGRDEEFAAFVHHTYGVPETLTTITVTPRASSGRAAVAIAGTEGAIIFVIKADAVRKTTRISPVVIGPIALDDVIVERVGNVNAAESAPAIAGLLQRHLGPGVTLDLLAPSPAH